MTTVNPFKTGSWNAEISLNNPEEKHIYSIEALSLRNSGEFDKALDYVLFESKEPEIKSIFVTGQSQKIDLMDETKRSIMFINPALEPYSFEIQFDNAEAIDAVYVKSKKGGQIKTLEALFDETSGTYKTQEYFDGNGGFMPSEYLSVEYRKKQSDVLITEEITNRYKDAARDFIENTNIPLEITSDTDSTLNASMDLTNVLQSAGNAIIDSEIVLYDELNDTIEYYKNEIAKPKRAYSKTYYADTRSFRKGSEYYRERDPRKSHYRF